MWLLPAGHSKLVIQSYALAKNTANNYDDINILELQHDVIQPPF